MLFYVLFSFHIEFVILHAFSFFSPRFRSSFFFFFRFSFFFGRTCVQKSNVVVNEFDVQNKEKKVSIVTRTDEEKGVGCVHYVLLRHWSTYFTASTQSREKRKEKRNKRKGNEKKNLAHGQLCLSWDLTCSR